MNKVFESSLHPQTYGVSYFTFSYMILNEIQEVSSFAYEHVTLWFLSSWVRSPRGLSLN